ncbi:MAG: response regulator [Acidobacteria bacterium]|nr:response regulator [Acidobacteriota bacterium]
MIVEDEPAIRRMLVTALRREPLRVARAADGVGGLEKVQQCDFAVTVVDLMMPRMDGFDLIAALPSADGYWLLVTSCLRTCACNGHRHQQPATSNQQPLTSNCWIFALHVSRHPRRIRDVQLRHRVVLHSTTTSLMRISFVSVL